MWFLILVGAVVAALLVVFGVMDLRARRRGMRYGIDEARQQPNAFDADIARCAAASKTARARDSRRRGVEVAEGPSIRRSRAASSVAARST
jgi:Sec-independent protein translocase protein TatA